MAGQVTLLQTLQPVLATLAEAALAASGGIAAQVWLTGPGDLCGECAHRTGCPDQSACLHLATVAGTLDASALPAPRLPLGAGPIGRVSLTGEGMTTRDGLAESGIADAASLRREGIKTVVALPLRHGRRSLGVVVVLAKSKPSDEQSLALAGAVRLGAEAVGNVEAYRTLAAERNRLAAKNARLRSGLGLPEEPEPVPPPVPDGPVPPVPPVAHPPTDFPAVAPPPAAPPPAGAPAPPPPPATEVLAATGAVLHPDRFTLPPLRSFAQVQREAILHALERTGWRVSGAQGAAAALGLKPTTLESKMKKLGIRRPRD